VPVAQPSEEREGEGVNSLISSFSTPPTYN
jgi:hypothetical protein